MEKSGIGREYYKVRSYQMDIKSRLTLTSMAGYLQESAGNHANSNGFGYPQMLKIGMLWVLTRVKIVVHKFPVWGDDLEMNTWVVNREKFFSRRDFEIKSRQNEVLISAMSGWMLLDIKTKRPHLVDDFPMEIQMFPDKLAIHDELQKIETPESIDFEQIYCVKYSDLDIANHVNNTQYQRIIIDTLPFEFRSNFHLQSFEINYLAEALISDELNVKSGKTRYPNEFCHEVIRESDKKLICRALSTWKED